MPRVCTKCAPWRALSSLEHYPIFDFVKSTLTIRTHRQIDCRLRKEQVRKPDQERVDVGSYLGYKRSKRRVELASCELANHIAHAWRIGTEEWPCVLIVRERVVRSVADGGHAVDDRVREALAGLIPYTAAGQLVVAPPLTEFTGLRLFHATAAQSEWKNRRTTSRPVV